MNMKRRTLLAMGMALSFSPVSADQKLTKEERIGSTYSNGPFRRSLDSLLANDAAVLSIEYRLAKVGESDVYDCAVDCTDAARFPAKHSEQFNIDPYKMGVRGGSAGGHLSLLTGPAGPDVLPTPDAPDRISFKEELIKPGTSSFERPPLVLSDREGRKSLHFGNRKHVEEVLSKKKLTAQFFNMKTDPVEQNNLPASKLELPEVIVNDDDRIEWDAGRSGYRHASAFAPGSGGFYLKLKAITKVTAQSYCYIHKYLPRTGKVGTQLKMAFLNVKIGKPGPGILKSISLSLGEENYPEPEISGLTLKGTVAVVRMTPDVVRRERTPKRL